MLCLDLKLVDGKWAKHFNISAVLPTQFLVESYIISSLNSCTIKQWDGPKKGENERNFLLKV